MVKHHIVRNFVVPSLSHFRLFTTPWTAAHQTSLSFTTLWSSLKLMSIELVMPYNNLSCVTPFSISSSYQVAKILELQVQHQSFQWIFRLIFFRMDWLDHLAVLGTLKSLLWHHCTKASIFQHLVFFMVQLSHTYKITGKATVLTIYGPLLAK